ncbi:MAG: hypothetical protein WD424_02320 [Paenibacillaceae bacterium]
MEKDTADIRNMTIAIQSVLVEGQIMNTVTINTITEEIKRRTMMFEDRMNAIINDFEGNPITYKSTAPHLNKSCYNCEFFQIGDDMIQGTCERKSHPSPTVSGIGTCDDFTSLANNSRLLSRQA